MKEETITLNTQEQKRAMVLNQIQAGQLSVTQAAGVLDLSARHVRRMVAAYEKEGPAVLAHGNRGRKAAHRISEAVRAQVLDLARTKYAGCNQQHLRDLLHERESITLSRSSVRRIVEQGGLAAPRQHKRPIHRRRRQRYAQEGTLLQIDGSRHAWLQERGPCLTLLAAIDDATGKVAAAVLRKPGRRSGLLSVGAPPRRGHWPSTMIGMAFLLRPVWPPRRIVLQNNWRASRPPVSLGDGTEELAITSIAARSPQAKGRVERLFGTDARSPGDRIALG